MHKRAGIDHDNALVQYDKAFIYKAIDWGYIVKGFQRDKAWLR